MIWFDENQTSADGRRTETGVTMSPQTYVGHFEKRRPKFEVSQEVLLEWLTRAHLQSRIFQENRDTQISDVAPEEIAKMRKFISRFACSPQKISSRGIHTDDAFTPRYDQMQIYQISKEHPGGVGMHERTKFFADRCDRIFEDFYPETATEIPDHIVHVTCTGYVSPSGAQKIVALRNWNDKTSVTHAYHMGCYASLPAIRIAQGLTRDQVSRIDVAHTEMCSLHLDPANHSPEQIVVQSLFADGFMKYQVSTFRPPQGFEIVKIKEWIVPDSAEMMTWFTSDLGMQMSLSKDVPNTIARHLESFLKDFDFEARNTIFAIHPGGPRIIDSIQDLLKLSAEQIAHATQVLFCFGNMSSATLPHIWQDILLDDQVPHGTMVMSLAFGPGLTIFGGLLKKL